jgi:hypothetical protein
LSDNSVRDSISKLRRKRLTGSWKHLVNGTLTAIPPAYFLHHVRDSLLSFFNLSPHSSLPLYVAVIHTVTGSFLLLNTDLHIADISEHMSRQQYVRLTMDTITYNMLKEGSSRHASTPDLVHNDSSSTLRTSMASAPPTALLPTGLTLGAPIELDRTTSLDRKDSTISLDRTSERTQKYSSLTPTPTNQSRPFGAQDPRLRLPSSASVGAISHQGNKWEGELETALKVSTSGDTSSFVTQLTY